MNVVAIVGSGPSLLVEDLDRLRAAKVRAFVTNDTFRIMPDAAALFACDALWWQANPDAAHFKGERYVSEDQRIDHAVFVPPRPPMYGGNSALRAAHLAQEQGADTILLLGIDLNDDQLTHWHGPHRAPTLTNPNDMTFARARVAWKAYSERYDRPDVINCTRRTSLRCFRQLPLELALELVAA